MLAYLEHMIGEKIVVQESNSRDDEVEDPTSILHGFSRD
jgi:hypothetical protein